MKNADFEDAHAEYLDLLDSTEKEQEYQKFLESNTRFIPREFVQNHGIHCRIAMRKLRFGGDYTSDFFYFSKSSDDWNAVLIEIEKPQSRYFKSNSNDLHSDFLSAVNQIKTWKAWLSKEPNKAAFLEALSPLRVPVGMADNPTFFKFVLVHGRRSEYSSNSIRRSLIQSYEEKEFKILSFDSLAEGLDEKSDLNIGIRHNEFIDILGDEIYSDGMFSFVEPTQFCVSRDVWAKLKEGSRWHNRYDEKGALVDAWKFAAEHVRKR